MNHIVSLVLAGALVTMLCICGCTQPAHVQTLPAQQPSTTTVQQPPPTSPPAPQESLAGVTWYLVAFNKGTGSVNALPGTAITALFDGNGKVTGSAGCNQYTASYSGALNGLAIGTPATTRMYCESPPGTMTQEGAYLSLMQGAASFKIEGDILTIMDGGGSAILTYTKVNPGTQTSVPLSGQIWHLVSFVDLKGQVLTPVAGTEITAWFDNGGNLTGKSGCNNYAGSYSVAEGGKITISGFAVTMMYCGDPGVMDQEQAYLAVLPRMTAYSITGKELILSEGTGKATLIYSASK